MRLLNVFFVVVLVVVFFFVALMLRVSFPSSWYLSKVYLNRVFEGNYDGAVQLALSNESCREFLKEDVRKHIEMYGGKEIKDVQIKVENGMGSDDEVQISIIVFQYADSQTLDWKEGRIGLLTDHPGLGLRYVCESLDFHGP